MKVSEKLQNELVDQVRKELESAYVYKGMQIYFEDAGLPGAAAWIKKQVHEELEHSDEFIKFLLEADCDVKLSDIKAQTTEYDSILDVFEKGLEHEKFITKSIEDLLELAIEEKNYAVENFLRGFINEQFEEEDNFRGVVDMIKFAGDDKSALFKVDGILGKRE